MDSHVPTIYETVLLNQIRELASELARSKVEILSMEALLADWHDTGELLSVVAVSQDNGESAMINHATASRNINKLALECSNKRKKTPVVV